MGELFQNFFLNNWHKKLQVEVDIFYIRKSSVGEVASETENNKFWPKESGSYLLWCKISVIWAQTTWGSFLFKSDTDFSLSWKCRRQFSRQYGQSCQGECKVDEIVLWNLSPWRISWLYSVCPQCHGMAAVGVYRQACKRQKRRKSYAKAQTTLRCYRLSATKDNRNVFWSLHCLVSNVLPTLLCWLIGGASSWNICNVMNYKQRPEWMLYRNFKFLARAIVRR